MHLLETNCPCKWTFRKNFWRKLNRVEFAKILCKSFSHSPRDGGQSGPRVKQDRSWWVLSISHVICPFPMFYLWGKCYLRMQRKKNLEDKRIFRKWGKLTEMRKYSRESRNSLSPMCFGHYFVDCILILHFLEFRQR